MAKCQYCLNPAWFLSKNISTHLLSKAHQTAYLSNKNFGSFSSANPTLSQTPVDIQHHTYNRIDSILQRDHMKPDQANAVGPSDEADSQSDWKDYEAPGNEEAIKNLEYWEDDNTSYPEDYDSYGIEYQENPSMTADKDEWYPYRSKAHFILDAFNHSPKGRLSTASMGIVIWALKQCGVPNVPSLHSYRNWRKELADNHNASIISTKIANQPDLCIYVHTYVLLM